MIVWGLGSGDPVPIFLGLVALATPSLTAEAAAAGEVRS